MWIGASCVAHVAIVAGLSRKPHTPPIPPFEPIELEVDFEAALPTEPQPQEAPPTTEPTNPADPGLAREPSAQHANAVVPTAERGPSGTEAATAPVASTGTWSVSAFQPNGIAILPAPNYGGTATPNARPAPQPEPVAPGQVSQTGGLREALAAKDTARGLGRGGAAVSAAHQASYLAPNSGRLVLALTFDASGAAISVQIAERSDADPSWDNYAKAVLAQAKKKASITLPSGARGLVVTLTIDSSVVLPSGASAGSSVKIDGARRDDEMSGSQGHFDLSDLGSQPKKRVSARVVKESVVY